MQIPRTLVLHLNEPYLPGLGIGAAEDSAPDFKGAGVGDIDLRQGEPVAPVTLPEAEGGDGALTYSLSPALPGGLAFDAAPSTTYTYTATDGDALNPDVAAATACNDELTLNVPNILLVAYARLRLGSADICPRRRGEGKNGSNGSSESARHAHAQCLVRFRSVRHR